MRTVLTASAFACALTSACGGTAAAGSPITIATGSGGGAGSKLALLEGVLGGSASAGNACLWIAVGSLKRPVVWPHGWSARLDPLRLVDDHGHVVAAVGDRLSLGGGTAPDGPAAYCPETEAFAAGVVSKAPTPHS